MSLSRLTSQLASRGFLGCVAGSSGASAGVQDVFARTLHTSHAACELRTDKGGEAEDFIERSLEKVSKATGKKKEAPSPSMVLTTRREAISLYRAVWRHSLLFVWKNEKGESWKEVIRDSTRSEFEAARFEADPEMVNRLLVTGRDYLDQAIQKFMAKRQVMIEEDAKKELTRPRDEWGK